MPYIILKFTPCTMGEPETTFKESYDTPFEARLFDCDASSSITKEYDLSDTAQYRKETEHTINLPPELADVAAFRVDIVNEQLK